MYCTNQLIQYHYLKIVCFAEEDRNKIADKAQNEAKSIDLSTVRLMFIAYLPDSNGAFTTMLKPVISETIFDSSKWIKTSHQFFSVKKMFCQSVTLASMWIVHTGNSSNESLFCWKIGIII